MDDLILRALNEKTIAQVEERERIPKLYPQIYRAVLKEIGWGKRPVPEIFDRIIKATLKVGRKEKK